MEPQTRFDLIAALEKWRLELATQSGLTSDDRRELETHLRDLMADLRQRGLNDEESFWVARLRVGSPQQLSEEFSRADPRRAWRERAFGLALALLAIQWVGLACDLVLRTILRSIPAWVTFYVPLWWLTFWRSVSGDGFVHIFVTLVLPSLLVLMLITRGRLRTDGPAMQFLFRSRLRLMLTSTVLVVALNWLNWMPWYGTPGFALYFGAESLIRYLGLIAIVTWLMPIQASQSPRQAVTN